MSETQIEKPDVSIEGTDDDTGNDDDAITEEQAAESEEGDDQGEFIDGQPATAPAARGLSEAEIEKRYKALEREQARHTTNVTKIMGDDADELIVCPLCEPELGGFLRIESFDHPRDETHEAMINVLKKPAQVTYREAPHSVQCHDCDGLGKVLSGSRVAQNELIACPTCKGAGNLVQGGSTEGGLVVPAGSEYVPSGLTHEPLDEERDEFGSPALLPDGRENPNYGKTMRHKDPTIENDYLTRLSGVS
jgi:uncharacterized protein YbaR (Trm112 family)